MKHYNIPIFIPHLGCPYECIYCDQKKIAAQQTIPDIQQVVNIIENHLQTIPQESHVEVAFFGGNFTAVERKQQEAYLGAVQPYLKQGRVHSIRVSTRPDCIDEAVLDLLDSYKVKMIELGVQSLSDRVLQASVRNYRPEDVYKSCHLIKARKFDLGIQLMIGLPQDSYDQDMKTTRQVLALRPKVVRIYPTLVIAGTPLEAMWQRGDYIPLSLQEAVSTCRDMFLLFEKDNIRVIRMGLYPGEELRSEGIIKAGPFHPSFGELVEQEIFQEQSFSALGQYFDKFGCHKEINIYVHSRDLSKMVGRKKKNLLYLRQELALDSIYLRPYPSPDRDWVGISAAGAEEPEFLLPRIKFIQEREESKDKRDKGEGSLDTRGRFSR